jgi:hypothetical protein
VNGVETGSKITATGGTDTAIDGGTVVNRDLWTTWLPPTPQRATFQNKGAWQEKLVNEGVLVDQNMALTSPPGRP